MPLLSQPALTFLSLQHQESGLHIAAWHGFPRIVEILCEAGASLHLNNEEQETALHVAAARGHIECMRCLLDSQDGQAVIDSQDRRGERITGRIQRKLLQRRQLYSIVIG